MILLGKDQVETMTSTERIEGLHLALKSVHENNISGDFVECGIWKGGNIVIAKKFFDSVNNSKHFFCYDTFEGMTEPGEFDSKKAHRTWQGKAKCEASIEEVINIFRSNNLLDDRIKFIKGDVRKTLLDTNNLPKSISILRLDTDFYDSTLIELKTLYPLLSKGGYLIVDDYGHWQGSKLAVDEYFGEKFVETNFKKLDYTGIIFQK
jgi:O-methyltransferase